MQEFHMCYHEETGITFASFYPGCISTTGLFGEHISLFRLLFPPFQKYITKGYVSEDEARKRLAQVVGEPSLTKSGVYWSKDSASFKNQLLEEATDVQKASKMWEISEKLIGLKVHSVVRNLDFVEIFSFVDDLLFENDNKMTHPCCKEHITLAVS
ncbi:hypothetical protein EZV62_008327 [Acer yangbiense]|uniref:Uncharacterized protein n=1 Tax=Acer yangbiense TaxID=1000413 RepID=A0A5C7IDT0_9ROSI|nr:hypothetical protein EZV62_008327 [Acer yangbiense]